MNDKALKKLYALAQGDGYTKSFDEFKQLISTNDEALSTMYGLAQGEGYTKDLSSFKTLMGVEAFDQDLPAVEEVQDVSSPSFSSAKNRILQDPSGVEYFKQVKEGKTKLGYNDWFIEQALASNPLDQEGTSVQEPLGVEDQLKSYRGNTIKGIAAKSGYKYITAEEKKKAEAKKKADKKKAKAKLQESLVPVEDPLGIMPLESDLLKKDALVSDAEKTDIAKTELRTKDIFAFESTKENIEKGFEKGFVKNEEQLQEEQEDFLSANKDLQQHAAFNSQLDVVPAKAIKKWTEGESNNEELLTTLNKTFGNYGVSFDIRDGNLLVLDKYSLKQQSIPLSAYGAVDGMKRAVTSQQQAQVPITISQIKQAIKERGTTPENQKIFSEFEMSQNFKANTLRRVGIEQEDGTTATTKFIYYKDGDNYKVIPTLFPINPDLYNKDKKTWIDLGEDLEKAKKLAAERGEVFTFTNLESAKEFAGGSYKSITPAENFARKFYRDRGYNYDAVRRNQNRLQELRELKQSILNKEYSVAYQAAFVGKGLSSKERALLKSIVPEPKAATKLLKKINSEIDRLAPIYDEMAGELKDLQQEKDGALTEEQKRLEEIYTAQALEKKTKLEEVQLRSLENFGVPLNDILSVRPETEEEQTQIIQLINDAVKGEAAYALSNFKLNQTETFFNEKTQKEIQGELVDGAESIFEGWDRGYNKGKMEEIILQASNFNTYATMGFSGGRFMDKDNYSDKEREEIFKEFAQIAKEGEEFKQSKIMNRFQNAYKYDGFWRAVDVSMQDGMYGMVSVAAESLGQMLPYGWKMVAQKATEGTLIGGAAGAPGGQAGIAAGAFTGFGKGLQLGMAQTVFAMEYSASILEEMEKYRKPDGTGYDLTNPEDVKAAFQNKEVWKRGTDNGVARGIPIALVDYFTMGLAGRVFGSSVLTSTPRRIALGLTERATIDPVTEGIGETAAQYSRRHFADGAEMDIGEIYMEMYGGVGNNTSMMAFNLAQDISSKKNIEIADNLTDINYLSSLNLSDEKISNWANKMQELGEIDADVNQQIQKNIKNKREATEIMEVGDAGRTQTIERRRDVRQRLMQLFAARDKLTSTENSKQIYKKKIADINEEIAEIGETYTVRKKIDEVNIENLTTTKTQVVTEDVAPEFGKYYIKDGKKKYIIGGERQYQRVTRDKFLNHIKDLTPEQITEEVDAKRLMFLNDEEIAENIGASLEKVIEGAVTPEAVQEQITTDNVYTVPMDEVVAGVETERIILKRKDDATGKGEETGFEIVKNVDGTFGIMAGNDQKGFELVEAELETKEDAIQTFIELVNDTIELKTENDAIQKQSTGEVDANQQASDAQTVETGESTTESQELTGEELQDQEADAVEEVAQEKLEKPYKTFNDGSGTMVTITIETTEKEGVKKTKFKTETANKKGEARTQNSKGYNTFEEAVENLDIDLQSEKNETALELVDELKEGKNTLPARVLEIREGNGIRVATVLVNGEQIDFRLKDKAQVTTQEEVETVATPVAEEVATKEVTEEAPATQEADEITAEEVEGQAAVEQAAIEEQVALEELAELAENTLEIQIPKKQKIAILQQELKSLIELKETLEQSPEYQIAELMPKILPESARAETGGKVGTKQDVSIGLTSKKGVTVERAAEELVPGLRDVLGYTLDEDIIRNVIIDVLLKGKKQYQQEILGDVNESIRETKQEISATKKGPKLRKKTKTKINEKEKTAAGSRLINESLQDATKIANRLAKRKGFSFRGDETSTEFNKERATRIAKAYEAMANDPNNPEVKAAYQALIDETLEQYQEILKDGYIVEIDNEDAYNNSQEMIEDVRKNKRLKIFATEAGFGDVQITDEQRKRNPLLQDSGLKDVNGKTLLVNDVFRFVHDFFGHAKEGNSFGPKGEEIAWRVHSQMYSPLARRAMTTETRGQNSWVNFSGVNEEAFKLRDKARQLRREGKYEEALKLVDQVYEMMSFAEQKIGLLPVEFTVLDAEVGVQEEIDNVIKILQKSFPSVTVSQTQEAFNEALKEEGVRRHQSGDTTILGITKDGKIILNPNNQSMSTAIHEFGHVWMDYLRSEESGKKGTVLLNRGMKLMDDPTNPYYKQALKEYGEYDSDGNLTNKDLVLEEALVEAMANKGESYVKAAKKSKFMSWLKSLFKFVKENLTRSKDLDVNKIKDLSLDEFIDVGIADLFSGKEVSIKFDPSINEDVARARAINNGEIFVKEARQKGFSDELIAESLKRFGLSQEEITALLEKKKVASQNKVVNERVQLQRKIRELTKKRKVSLSANTVANITSRIIKAKLLNKDGTINQEAIDNIEAYIEEQFVKAEDRAAIQEAKQDARFIRTLLRERNKGTSEIKQIQTQLGKFIKKNLPEAKYTKAEVNRLISKVKKATDEKSLREVMDEVEQIFTKKKVDVVKETITKQLKTKREKVEGGRVKGVGVDTETAKSLDTIQENIATSYNDSIEKNAAINKRIEELEKQIPDLIGEKLAQAQKELSNLEIARQYNDSFGEDAGQLITLTDLEEVSAELQQIIDTGRSNYQNEMQAATEYYNKLKSDLFQDIAEISVDLNTEKGKERAQEWIDSKKASLAAKNKALQKLSNITNSLTKGIGKMEAMQGLLAQISRGPAEMYGGVASEMILDRLNDSNIKFMQGANEQIGKIESKAEQIWGKNWKKVLRNMNNADVRIDPYKDKSERIEESESKIQSYKEEVQSYESQLKALKRLVETSAKTKAQSFDAKKTKRDLKSEIEAAKGRLREETNFLKSLKSKDNKILFTQAKMYYLYNQYKDAANHPAFEKTFGENYEKVMEDITNKLDPKVKEWADWQVDVFFPSVYGKYNEVYKKIYRTNMPWNSKYAGKLIRKNEKQTDIAETLNPSEYRTAVGGQSTKARIKNNSAIRTDVSGNSVLNQYVNQMEFFAAYAETVRDVQKLMASKEIKEAITRTSGEGVYSVLNERLKKVMTLNATSIDESFGLADRFTSGFAVSALGINPTVMIKQAVSALTFASDIGYINWTKYGAIALGSARFGSPNIKIGGKQLISGEGIMYNKVWKEIEENSVYIQERYKNQDITRVLENHIKDVQGTELAAKKESINNFLMTLVKKGDKMGVMGSIPNYLYYKEKFAKENPSKTDQEIIDMAIRKIEGEIKTTQQSADKVDKDTFQLSDYKGVRALGLFQSSGRALWRKEIINLRELIRKGNKFAKVTKETRSIREGYKAAAASGKGRGFLLGENMRGIITYHFAVPMTFQWVALGMPGLASDWDEEDTDEMMWAAILGNFNSIFILGDIFAGMRDAFLGKSWAGSVRGLPISTFFGGISADVQKYRKAVKPETKDKYRDKLMWKVVGAASIFTGVGIPLNNLSKLFENYSEIANGDLDFGEGMLRALNYSNYLIENDGGDKLRFAKQEKQLEKNLSWLVNAGALSLDEYKELLEESRAMLKEMEETQEEPEDTKMFSRIAIQGMVDRLKSKKEAIKFMNNPVYREKKMKEMLKKDKRSTKKWKEASKKVIEKIEEKEKEFQ